MRHNLTAYLNTAIFGIVLAVTALIPLFFSSLTTEYFEAPKLALLIVAVLLLLVLWGVSWVTSGKVVITRITGFTFTSIISSDPVVNFLFAFTLHRYLW